MNRNDIAFLSATELGTAIESKQISPVEAVEAYLERIERIDPKVNSYITVMADQAREEARQAEAEIQRGDYRGPLHGIPIAIKDQIYTKGVRTTDASKIRADFVPDKDATVVTNLKKSGAILLGKLNMSEFAHGEPQSSHFGPARNPWDLTRSPGVSSTGSGAATAARLCATSLGEDTGGSIRGPAANCGLVGLRPTWGRVSRYGVDGAGWSFDTIGPISRTVADCAITIGGIAGYDPQDPSTHNVPVPDYRQALTGDIRGLKVGVVRELLNPKELDLDPKMRQAVINAIEVLAELGAEVREVSMPLAEKTGYITRAITHVDRVNIHPEWLRERPEDYHYDTRVHFTTANLIPGQVYLKAQKLRSMVRDQVLGLLEDVDVLIQPTSGHPANIINLEQKVGSQAQAKAALAAGGFRGPYSLTGNPALSILCGFTSDGDGGLPLAMQIAGRPFDEATVLRVAHAYEQATNWSQRVPPAAN
ncbi:MAG: amidase [SAR202 cluster bacterium]|nr:amidase [SAR202 cluster bacterium]